MLGLRLRDVGQPWFTWRDLKSIVRGSLPSSALARAIDPEGAQWSDMTPMLLREVIYEVQVLRYVQGGGKGAKPKRIQLPGQQDADTSTFGAEPLEIEDMADWLGGPFAALQRQN